MSYDVIVAGGSYAGMSAALQLVRARRKVLVVDAGRRRNRFAAHSHGFLTQDGIDPAQIAAGARQQLSAYPDLAWIDGEAVGASGKLDAFTVAMQDGSTHHGRRLILAPGVSDTLPDVPGLKERWGKSVFHCPYCHGYELDGGPLGVMAVGAASMHQALLIPEWGQTTLFLDGIPEPDAEQLAHLEARGVTIERTPVARISGETDVELTDGRTIRLAGLFTASRTRPSTPLAEDFGLTLDEGPLGRYIRTDPLKETTMLGVFACGDAARPTGTVALAVGDGALAGASTHRSLVFP